jgi:hypothetical protein
MRLKWGENLYFSGSIARAGKNTHTWGLRMCREDKGRGIGRVIYSEAVKYLGLLRWAVRLLLARPSGIGDIMSQLTNVTE